MTDFEFRVWSQYLLSADDFGVMRASAVTLQSANDALHNRPVRLVQKALERVIAVGLVNGFEHQGRRYVFQRDWMHWQKIEWPRVTIEPCPAPDVLATLTGDKEYSTAELFGKHPGGASRRKPKDSPSDFQILPDSRAPARAERLRLTAPAQGSRLTAEASDPERAGRLLENYARWYAEERKGARLLLLHNSLEFQDASRLVAIWDDETLEKIARIVLTTDDQWISGTDRGFAILVKKATWAHDKLRAWEAKQAQP